MGKIQPFKAVGSAIGGAIKPVTNVLSGKGNFGDLLNIGMMAYGGGGGDFFKRFGTETFLKNAGNSIGTSLLGSALGGSASGGKGMPIMAGAGGSGNPMLDALLQQQMGIMQQGLPFILDAGARSDQYRQNALRQGARSAESLGGQVAQQTGNDFMRSAVALGNQNQANEAANDFQAQEFSGPGRAAAYQAALGLTSMPFQSAMGIEDLALRNKALALQKYGINKQYQQPTFANQLFGTLGGILPSVLQNNPQWFKSPTKPTTSINTGFSIR